MLRIISAVLLTSLLSLGGATAAMAASNPSGTGPPNQSCQAFEGPSGTNAPGNSGTSPGSVFNEPGFGSANGGTGGNAYNPAGRPAPYQRRCLSSTHRTPSAPLT